MIIQENNFLRIYNEMNKLWEAAGTEKSSSRTNKEDFTFNQIVKYAEEDSKKISEQGLTLSEVQYWQTILFLLEQKQLRLGDAKSTSWVERFMRFYKAYKVEEALLNWIRDKGFSGCSFGDGEDHEVLTSDDKVAVVPDINITNEYTIECKSRILQANIHGASLVARHDSFKNTTVGEVPVRFWIVGRAGTGLAATLFKSVPTCERASLTQPFAIAKQEPTDILRVNMPPIYTWLTTIDAYLSDDTSAKDIKLTRAIDNQTQALADTIQALDLSVDSAIATDSATPAQAANQLADLATDLADTLSHTNSL